MKSLRAFFALLLITLPLQLNATGKHNVAIITGSSSGLGFELAKLAMEQQMRLVLVDINPAASEAMAAAYEMLGGEAEVVAVDLAKPALRPAVIEAALKRFGRIDYLINNAGYSYITSFADHEMGEARRNFEVNYWAYIDLAHRVVPTMKKQGSGLIINISSILGFTPANPHLAVYSANKHALVGYFQSAAPELKAHGIGVKVVMPAGMKTMIFQNAVGKNLDKSKDISLTWEHPSIVANEIFEELHNGEVLQFPSVAKAVAKGYVDGLQKELK